MSAAALLLLRRYGAPLALAALLIALLAWGNHAAEQRGARAERALWQARMVRATAVAQAQAQARAAARDAAFAATAERARRYAAARRPIEHEVIRYVQSPAAHVACPDADGVRLGSAAIAAANAALAAAR